MANEAEHTAWPDWVRIAFIGRHPRRTLLRLAVIVALAFLVFGFILLPIRVIGASMLPTYRDGGVNFVNRLAYLRHGPQRGDVVAIRLAGKHVMFMKRIVGLPGETVEFIDGQLFIDGKLQPEPYVKFPYHWDHPPKTPRRLEPNQYFFLGDNRTMRPVDHEYGAAKRDRIVGKVLL